MQVDNNPVTQLHQNLSPEDQPLVTAGNDQSIATMPDENPSNEDMRTLIGAPDDSEQSLVEPDLFNTRQPNKPIYKSIPLKAGVAAGLSLFVVVPAMVLFSGNLLKKSNVARTDATETGVVGKTDEQLALAQAAEENTTLKKELALQNQEFSANELDNETAANTSTPTGPAPVARGTSSPTTPVTRPATAISTRTPVRPAAVARPPARPVSTVRPSPIAQSSRSPRFTTPREETVNLAAIAESGDYGTLPSRPLPRQGSNLSESGLLMAASQTSIVPNRGVLGNSAVSIPVSISTSNRDSTGVGPKTSQIQVASSRPIPKVMQDVVRKTISDSPSPSEGPILTEASEPDLLGELALAEGPMTPYEEEMNLIMGDSFPDEELPQVVAPSYIAPGTTAMAEVTTAITWAADMPQTQGALTLTSPLVSNGFEVLPTGTDLIVQISAISDSGAVSLQTIAIVLPGSAEMTSIDIPDGALAFLNVDGGYPVATAEASSERLLRKIDRQQAILGAMSGAGSFLARPERESNFFGLGNSSTVTEYGSGSLVGSLLAGAANQMLNSRSSRLEAEADQLMERPTIWSLGT
ncbi:MAG: hypothetical protein ABG776_12585, partial [Cyanobacteria bacterium J06555_13]